MAYEDIAAAFTALLTIVRSALYLVDLLRLDTKFPAIKPVIDHVGAFLGGRKERDI